MRPLAKDEVRVLWLALDGLADEALARAALLLDDEEHAHAARKKVPDDRRLYQAAHALLRLALSSVAPVAPPAWRFGRDERGRRTVAAPEDAHGLSFSLSHTRGLAACALSNGRDVGVDAEHLRRRELEDRNVARSCFTPEEVAMLGALAPERRAAERLALFTLKEAWAKARGLGLALDLQSFSIALEPLALVRAADDDPSRWLLARHSPTGAHTLALAARRVAGEALVVRFVEGKELL
jgi:4'-phosphopantetheinyl transferase